MKIKAALQTAETLLSQSMPVSEAKLETQLLLQHLLNVNRAWLIAHADDALAASIHGPFEALIKRRSQGNPIAYILGYREFFGLRLKVTTDTLIPRPDTETLVEVALSKLVSMSVVQNQSCNILDLGTGTGAIALAIAKHAPQAHITAVDASEPALNVALENAQHLAIDNISFVLSNWFTQLPPQTFDLIVSNPPYIVEHDAHLKLGDVRFEPISALVSGADGLNDIRHIISHAPQFLKPNGWLMLEHGYNQAADVRQLLAVAGFTELETKRDLGANERVTFGCIT